MKKKAAALCATVALAAVALGGATLAYFTDTDSKTNTFTTGNVDIQLIEQQRNTVTTEDGTTTTTLGDFVGGKLLMPIVGSAQGEKDGFGLPVAENYVDKIVTVKNLAADAYVRVYVAVPAALEDDDASKSVLHWNIGNKFTAAGNYAGNDNAADYTANMGESVQLAGTTAIEGISYNVYYQTYKKALKADEVTGSAFMVGMYLDKGVDYVAESVDADGEIVSAYYTINGMKIEFDFSKGVNIPVFAVGAQAAGFSDADKAINAAFGESFNPWA